MSATLWVAVLACAFGTLLMRVVPFLWMQRRLNSESGLNDLPQWLGILGPLMIAAVLGVSLMPVHPSPASWLATLLGLVATLLVWRRTRSLGLPVAAGVATFGAVVVGGQWLFG
ncbi:AzlD domain-containing protein [Salinicola aestuarinus]|uniref:AzlD domain-containing protein n=1 Tax=Salinicola aestuarinus TaxID=1949082 RepID=UPI000DA17009|nr:AzlD domain-containing protein [Salinicola aestuarinus]